MRALTFDSGGRACFPSKPTELEGVYDAIARELVSGMWARGSGAVRRRSWLPVTRCWLLAGSFLSRGYGRLSLE